MSNTNHPLANIPKERLELAIAQALTELCDQWANVTVKSSHHTGNANAPEETSLQLHVSFQPRNAEEEDTEH